MTDRDALARLIEAVVPRDWLPEGHIMLMTERQVAVVYPDGRIVVKAAP